MSERFLALTDELLRLYRLGWSDTQIARALRVSSPTVGQWRKKLGLPALYRRGQVSEVGRKLRNQRIAEKARLRWAQRPARTDRPPGESKRQKEEREAKARWEGKARPALGWYDAQTDELLRAVLRFRAEHSRPPTLIEGFRILKALGWSKD